MAHLPGYRTAIPGRWLTAENNQSGVPLGGLGTGFLELRPDGQTHDVKLKTLNSSASLPSLRISLAFSREPSVTLISSAGSEVVSSARYFGHYPAADLDFGKPTKEPVSVHCRAFSPFVPGDSELSNTPAAIFVFRLKSDSSKPVPVKLQGLWLTPANSVLEANPVPQAAEAHPLVFHTEGLSLSLTGSMPGSKLRTIGQSGVEISGVIPPRTEATAVIVAGWHAQSENGRDGRAYAPRYTERFRDAGEVTRFVAKTWREIERKIIAWQEKIYDSGMPDWMKDALVNSLALLPRNTFWFTDGFHLSEQDGKVVEAIGSHLEGSIALERHFPGLVEGALRRLASRQAESGEIPGRLGLEGSLSAPHFGPGKVHATMEFLIACRRVSMTTRDRTFVTQMLPSIRSAAEFVLGQDTDSDGLANELVLPVSLAALDRYRRDWPVYGTSTYTSFMGLAALRSAEEMARVAGDDALAGRCRERVERAATALAENLWCGKFYRLYTDPDGFKQSDTSFIAALAGQAHAWVGDLGEVAPKDQLLMALRTVADLHASVPNEVPSGMTPEGAVDGMSRPYSASTAPRDVWLYVTAALYAANKLDSPELKQKALELGRRAYDVLIRTGTLWNQSSLYRAGDVAPIGERDYFGNLAIWMLPAALDAPPRTKEPEP